MIIDNEEVDGLLTEIETLLDCNENNPWPRNIMLVLLYTYCTGKLDRQTLAIFRQWILFQYKQREHLSWLKGFSRMRDRPEGLDPTAPREEWFLFQKKPGAELPWLKTFARVHDKMKAGTLTIKDIGISPRRLSVADARDAAILARVFDELGIQYDRLDKNMVLRVLKEG